MNAGFDSANAKFPQGITLREPDIPLELDHAKQRSRLLSTSVIASP